MYKVFCFLSVYIRFKYLENPFINLFTYYIDNEQVASNAVLYAEGFDLIIGSFLLWAISYRLVGIIYESGDAPLVGSILYLGIFLLNGSAISWIGDLVKGYGIEVFLISCLVFLVIELVIIFKIRDVTEGLYY